MGKRIPIIVDSGIGDNIDDAFALALACCSPEVELIGVTTTDYEPEIRALLARRLLGAYGKLDIPVAAGNEPRFRDRRVGLKDLTQRRLAREQAPMSAAADVDAVEFMARTITARPGTTIIATGPLTNIAALFRRYPAVAGSVERVIFMGGWPTHALPEHNIQEDPGAVAALLDTDVKLTIVGYEVTLECALRAPHLHQLEGATSRGPGFLHLLFREWHRATRSDPPVMHDPLTVALLCNPSLVTRREASVRVHAEEDGPRSGTLYLQPEGGRSVEICTSVDAAGYLDFLIERVAPDADKSPLSSLDARKWRVGLRGAHELDYYPGWAAPASTIEHHLLGLVISGRGIVHLPDGDKPLSEGEAFYFHPGQSFGLSTPDGMRVRWIHFDAHLYHPGLPPSPLPQIPDLPALLETGSNFTVISEHTRRITERWQNPSAIDTMLCQASLYEVLAQLSALVREQERQLTTDAEAALAMARDYIDSRVHTKITLDALADHVGLNKYYLAHRFKEAYGVSPLRYHALQRIDYAKSLLMLPHLSVKEIASSLGYSSVSAFTHAFTREVGMSPTDFRE